MDCSPWAWELHRVGKAWNNWFHCVGNTYGTWVRGDPRGWRSRHHREHVEGDYRHPPPKGKYAKLEAYSRFCMKRDRVLLGPTARRVACLAMVDALRFHCVEVVDLCVTEKHFHALVRFQPLEGHGYPERVPIAGVDGSKPVSGDRSPRHLMGIAKKESARALSKRGLAPEGGVWGVRFRAKPIRDRAHQVRVARYIPNHKREGAAVWTLLRKDLCVRGA